MTLDNASKRASVLEPFDSSLLARANWWFDTSWYGLLIAGLIAAFAACVTVSFLFLQVWSSGIRDRYSDWRTSTLEVRHEEAKRDSVFAQERIKALDLAVASANAKAADAQLALEKYKTPRSLSMAQQARIVADIKPWFGQPASFNVAGDPESIALMKVIQKILADAGWTLIASQIGDIEAEGFGAAFGTGVEIQVPSVAANGTKAASSAVTLAQALSAEGIDVATNINDSLTNVSAVNVMIGKKP